MKQKLPVFKLEDYLGKWEFKAPYLFCNSDMETLSLQELLALSDPEGRELWENLRLGYTEVSGLPQLRQEIAGLYKVVNPNEILTTSGAEEGIYCALHSILNAEDHVIVFTPCYQSHESIPKSIGCQVAELPLNPKNNWQLDLSALEAAINPKTKLIMINYPHNPTGMVLDHETLQSLIDIARRHDIYIFSDEVYSLMEVDPTDRTPPICDLYEKGISLGVMSKAFGLAGLRIGWIATQDSKIKKESELFKHYLSICNSAPSEVLALIALRARDRILKRNHQIITLNLALLDNLFKQKQDLLRWTRPQGGCVGFPELLGRGPIEDFAAQLVEKTGVLIMPGSIYNWPGNHFRIGFGRKNMPQALDRFIAYLENDVLRFERNHRRAPGSLEQE